MNEGGVFRLSCRISKYMKIRSLRINELDRYFDNRAADRLTIHEIFLKNLIIYENFLHGIGNSGRELRDLRDDVLSFFASARDGSRAQSRHLNAHHGSGATIESSTLPSLTL